MKFPWKGNPHEPPAIHAGTGFAYASWNGATDVASWQLDTGSDPNALTTESTVPKKGFEDADRGVGLAARVSPRST